MTHFHKHKNKYVEASKASVKQKQKTNNQRSIYLTILGVILLGILYLVGNWIGSGFKLLENLKFSNNIEAQFLAQDRTTSLKNANTFTIFLGVTSLQNGKRTLESFTIIKVNKSASSATAISLPTQVYFSPFRYFRSIQSDMDVDIVKIKDLLVVGDLNEPSIPYAYAYYEIEELLALQFDAYFYVDKNDLEAVSKLASGNTILNSNLSEGEKWVNFFRGLSLFRAWTNHDIVKEVKSNLSVTDAYDFARSLKALPPKSITYLTVPNDMLIDTVDARGEYVKLVTPPIFDQMLEDYSSNDKIDREQARVEIFNGSAVDGLGARYERWVKHMGVDVIRIENAPGTWTKQDRTVIFVTNPEKCPVTLNSVSSLWSNPKIVTGRPEFVTTGDIVIVLGMDFYRD